MKSSVFPILGIDPGYDRVGWAIIDNTKNQIYIKSVGVIQTQKNQSLWQRYLLIDQQLNQIINHQQPKILAIESIFFAKNTKTALQVAEAKGVIIKIALDHHLLINEFTPKQVKSIITGDGNCDKKSLTKILELELKTSFKNLVDDAVDAIAIGYCQALIDHSVLV